jgi:hypothetical protein
MNSTRMWMWAVAALTEVALGRPGEAAVRPGDPGDFGLGAILGSPTGLSGKYWLTPQTAIDGALAWHFGHDDRLQIHADHLWHLSLQSLSVPNGRMPLYVGAGLRVITGKRSEAGLRIPLGLSFLFDAAPVELFAELVPVVKFAPDTEAQLDGGVGVRYYLKTARGRL